MIILIKAIDTFLKSQVWPTIGKSLELLANMANFSSQRNYDDLATYGIVNKQEERCYDYREQCIESKMKRCQRLRFMSETDCAVT